MGLQFEVRAAGIVSVYYGNSFKEAEEVFGKCKTSAVWVQRFGPNDYKIIRSKERDKFASIMEKAFNKQ